MQEHLVGLVGKIEAVKNEHSLLSSENQTLLVYINNLMSAVPVEKAKAVARK